MAKDRVWTDDMYVLAHRFAREGKGDMSIAKGLGVSWVTFRKWLRKKPALKSAIAAARDPKLPDGVVRFPDYVYRNLEPHTKKVFREILGLLDKDAPDNAVEMIEQMLQDQGERMRKHLFCHFLVHFSFNPSDACRAVNIGKKKLEKWMLLDAEFQQMVEEIHWHKKNYCLGALMDLVACRDAGAVKFALANLDKENFGKQSTLTIEHKGEVKHEHIVDVKTLPLEQRMKILEALEDKKVTTDAEYTDDDTPGEDQ